MLQDKFRNVQSNDVKTATNYRTVSTFDLGLVAVPRSLKVLSITSSTLFMSRASKILH